MSLGRILVRLQRLSQIRLPHAGGRESLGQCSNLHPGLMIPDSQRLDFLPQPIQQALGIDESSARRLGILAVTVDIFEQPAFGAGGALLDGVISLSVQNTPLGVGGKP